MKNKLLYILLFTFCCFSVSLAQSNDWKFFGKSFDINSFADEGNYIWIGQDAGVVRINKTTGAKIYYNKANCPIPDNWVNAIAIDHNNVKWFGTWLAGIARFDGTNWQVFNTTNSPLTSLTITALTVDSSNNIWVVLNNFSGIFKYDGTNWSLFNSTNSGLPNNNIYSIYADGNTIWVTTQAGLTKFDGINWTVYSSCLGGSSLCKDRLGNFWMNRGNGVAKFDGTNMTIYNNTNTNIQNTNISSITVDTNNIIWAACTSYNLSPHVLGGVMSFNGTSWTKYDTTNALLSDTDYGIVFTDKSNNIWLGGSNSGMADVKTSSSWTAYDPSCGNIIGQYIRQVVFDNNAAAFIGSSTYSSVNGFVPNQQELVKYDWNTWTNLNNYTTSSWALSSDKFGYIYVKNPTGIEKYDGSNWTSLPTVPSLTTNIYPISLNLSAIATDSLGGIWIDYLNKVLVSYNPSNNVYTYIPSEALAYYNGSNWVTFDPTNSPILDTLAINRIKVDHHNNVWLSTTKGLIRFDGTNWTNYKNTSSFIQTSQVSTFTFDSLNNLWFGGASGFVKFDGLTCSTYPSPILSNYLSQGIMETDIDGKIWSEVDNTLISFDGTNWTTLSYTNSPLLPLFLIVKRRSLTWSGNTPSNSNALILL